MNRTSDLRKHLIGQLADVEEERMERLEYIIKLLCLKNGMCPNCGKDREPDQEPNHCMQCNHNYTRTEPEPMIQFVT